MPLRAGLSSRNAVVRVSWALLVVSVLGLLTSGCAGASPGKPSDATATVARGPKRIVAAMNGEPNSLLARMNSAQITIPGATNREALVNGSLTEIDGDGNVAALFAQAVPTQENGLWQLTAD